MALLSSPPRRHANHVRSNSFPSRPHPQASHVEEQLNRLRSCEAASTSSSSISHTLNSLQDLHDSLYELIQLPNTQQSLAQEQNKKSIEQLLDGSLRLLEVSRKSLRKSLEKVMKSLKTTENQGNNEEALAVLGEAESVTISVFETLLRFISGSKCSKWSLVTRLMNQRRVSCEVEAADANEFSAVDSAFHMFVEKKSKQPSMERDKRNLILLDTAPEM